MVELEKYFSKRVLRIMCTDAKDYEKASDVLSLVVEAYDLGRYEKAKHD